MPNPDRPKPHERVCYNCKYMLWMVGIGMGVCCGYEYHTKGDKHVGMPEKIPHLGHTCDKFKFRNEDE